MRSVLVPFDGSKQAEAVVRDVIRAARRGEVSELRVLNVQPAFNRHIGQFVGLRTIRDFQRDEGQKALAAARRLLDKAGLIYSLHIRAGDTANTIVRAAKELRVDEIVMGAGNGRFLGNLLQQILLACVIRRASVPVVVMRGAAPAFDLDLSANRPRPTYLP